MKSPAVQVIDLSKLKTPQSLAEAIRDSLSASGFLFIQGHGLERQVDELFGISRKDISRSIRISGGS